MRSAFFAARRCAVASRFSALDGFAGVTFVSADAGGVDGAGVCARAIDDPTMMHKAAAMTRGVIVDLHS
jgi:hypothetical protein